MFDPRQSRPVRVRIQNIKSGRYLSIEKDQSNWNNDDASLSIRDWLNKPVLESPQVWNIIPFRTGNWILLNQYSMAAACIRARSVENNATVIQYHPQIETMHNYSDPFQLWIFEPISNGNWYIQNLKSKRYIGPENGSIANDHFCIQWDKQPEDSYQQWEFEEI